MERDKLQVIEIASIFTIIGLTGSAIGFTIRYLIDKRTERKRIAENAMVQALLPYYSRLLEIQSRLYLFLKANDTIHLKDLSLKSNEFYNQIAAVYAFVRDRATRQMIANFMYMFAVLDELEDRDYIFEEIVDQIEVLLETLQSLQRRIEWYVWKYSDSFDIPPAKSSFPKPDPFIEWKVLDSADTLLKHIAMTNRHGDDKSTQGRRRKDDQATTLDYPSATPPQPYIPQGGNYPYIFKIVTGGEGGVGKTAIVTRFAEGHFIDEYRTTIGTQIIEKNLEVGTSRATLKIWDTAGQSRFSHIRPMYFAQTEGAILVYDVSRKQTFDETYGWFRDYLKDRRLSVIVLVANKIDLSPRTVTIEMGDRLRELIRSEFDGEVINQECSAKTGQGVIELFEIIATKLIERRRNP